MTRTNPEFYESLNGALDALQETRTIELELKSPLYLEEVRALSFRLLRRGRVDQVQTLKMRCCFHQQEAEQCIDVLENLIQNMRQLESLFLSNVTYGPDCHRLVRGCRSSTAILRRLALGCENTSRDCITPNALELRNPFELEKLGLGYICGSQMDGFVRAFSTMTNLRELGVGLGQGTTDEALLMLFQCVLNLSKVKGLYLWGPDAPEFVLSSSSLAGLNKVLRKGMLDVLSLEDLPNLFSDRQNLAFKECLSLLRTCTSLQEIVLEGDLGLEEEATLCIFKALEANNKLCRFHIEAKSISLNGWKRVLRSLSRNKNLSDLCLKTNTGSASMDVLAQLIVRGLRRNVSILHFSCFINGNWHFCSHSSSQLHFLSKRNRTIALARETVPCEKVPEVITELPCFPSAVTTTALSPSNNTTSTTRTSFNTNLLPRTITRMYQRGGCSPVYVLVQNFAAKLVDPSSSSDWTATNKAAKSTQQKIAASKRKRICQPAESAVSDSKSRRRKQDISVVANR